jgi:hypothetical protein
MASRALLASWPSRLFLAWVILFQAWAAAVFGFTAFSILLPLLGVLALIPNKNVRPVAWGACNLLFALAGLLQANYIYQSVLAARQ